MPTYFNAKSYHQVNKNGKVVDKKIIDASYDGNNAVINTLNNRQAYRVELDNKDLNNIFKQFVLNRAKPQSKKKRKRKHHTRRKKKRTN
tara:strand:- start:175 stop:441 length:267 start_codon:yes stop_codon:yes gene_type:complete